MTYQAYYNVDNTLFESPKKQAIETFPEILDKFGLNYKQTGYHLQVGEITDVKQGWILHVSVVRWQIPSLLYSILDALGTANLPFKILKDKEIARDVLDGNLGYSQVGKIITIYPRSDEDAVSIAKTLIELTKPYKGPEILTDVHLGGTIYTRYGSFLPIIKLDQQGKEEKYIHNEKGELVADNYTIPFQIPLGVKWAFLEITNFTPAKRASILHKIYKPILPLKLDVKGNVIKALYLRNILSIKWCVIKEGRANMWSDEADRDMINRIIWQRDIHTNLSNKIPMPKVLDYFTEGGTAYLVTEYIKGQSLHEHILELTKNSDRWADLPAKTRLIILNHLLKVISIIKKLHENGFIHRDITPVNFMVDKNNNLFLIDNELAYCQATETPTPPFEAGTHGFMSPQQISILTPTTKDDIYGLGATMIIMLAGLSPLVIQTSDTESLRNNLNFLINNKQLADITADCLQYEPLKRPSLTDIESIIQSHYHLIKDNQENRMMTIQDENVGKLKDLIQKGIHGLSVPPTIISNNLWYSKASSKNDISNGKESSAFEKSAGFFEGISGVLYFLSRANKMGYSIETCYPAYYNGWEYMKDVFYKNKLSNNEGLYGGSAGLAMSLASGINCGLLPDNIANRSLIYDSLNYSARDLTLANGLAGLALATLHCQFYLEDNTQLLNTYISNLIISQHENGYWILFNEKPGNGYKQASFAWGNIGILWTLLEYAVHTKDINVKASILKSLKLLIRHADAYKTFLKQKGFRSLLNLESLSDYIMGVPAALIKSYEVFRDEKFKNLAEEILEMFPAHIVNDNLTQNSGQSGLGEIYLEAYRVFENKKWKDRARWIVELLVHTHHINQEGVVYWCSNNSIFATADFMVGNSGILHFLIRYANYPNLPFRLSK